MTCRRRNWRFTFHYFNLHLVYAGLNVFTAHARPNGTHVACSGSFACFACTCCLSVVCSMEVLFQCNNGATNTNRGSINEALQRGTQAGGFSHAESCCAVDDDFRKPRIIQRYQFPRARLSIVRKSSAWLMCLAVAQGGTMVPHPNPDLEKTEGTTPRFRHLQKINSGKQEEYSSHIGYCSSYQL